MHTMGNMCPKTQITIHNCLFLSHFYLFCVSVRHSNLVVVAGSRFFSDLFVHFFAVAALLFIVYIHIKKYANEHSKSFCCCSFRGCFLIFSLSLCISFSELVDLKSRHKHRRLQWWHKNTKWKSFRKHCI